MRTVSTDDIEQWLGAPLELVRVVEVGVEVRNTDGGRTVVTSVEVWNTMLVVRWTVVSPAALRHPGDRAPRLWECRDDVGNQYQLRGGGGGGGERHWHGTAEFSAVDPKATKLFIVAEHSPGSKVEVDL